MSARSTVIEKIEWDREDSEFIGERVYERIPTNALCAVRCVRWTPCGVAVLSYAVFYCIALYYIVFYY